MMWKAEKIFASIYTENSWGDPESRSGPGSGVARTELLRPRLTRLMQDLGVRSILDLPCGDFNWMRLTELPGIDYTGADIVRPLIERNHSLYSQPGRKFLLLNMVCDSLPKTDLILCRDGLVHLSFAEITCAIRKMIESGTTYLLATTFTAHSRNQDIATGDWRRLNLTIAPFCFPEPLQMVTDARPDGTMADKMLALYRLADLSNPLLRLERKATEVLVPNALRRGLVRLQNVLGARKA